MDAITIEDVDSPKGHVMLMRMDGTMSEKFTEGDDRLITNKPVTWNVPYTCEMLKANVIIFKKTVENYATANQGSFEDKLMPMIAKGLRQDMSKLVFRGDTTLPGTSRLNRLLHTQDGLLKLADSGQVIDKSGKGLGDGMFSVMEDAMPEEFHDADNLKWIFNSKVDATWRLMLGLDRKTGIGDTVVTTGGNNLTPSGIPKLISNSIPRNMGPSGTPDSITDDTGNLIARVNALLPDATDSTGRRVKITYKPTGVSETLTVSYDGSSHNIITTVGMLGQDAVDTTAANYTIQIQDETACFLMNPKGLAMVVTNNDWEAYREFNVQLRAWVLTFYYNVAVLLPQPESVVYLKRLSLPQITDWNAWSYPAA
jgi:hypothetical protein